MLRNTGARGLRAIMEEVLLSVMYEIPSDPNAEKVQITRETVLEKVYPDDRVAARDHRAGGPATTAKSA